MNIKIKNGTDTRNINSEDVKSWEAIGWKVDSSTDSKTVKPLVKDTKTSTSNKE
jgi:hypothetical protein